MAERAAVLAREAAVARRASEEPAVKAARVETGELEAAQGLVVRPVAAVRPARVEPAARAEQAAQGLAAWPAVVA